MRVERNAASTPVRVTGARPRRFPSKQACAVKSAQKIDAEMAP